MICVCDKEFIKIPKGWLKQIYEPDMRSLPQVEQVTGLTLLIPSGRGA
jgi:hypothetical protein